MKVGEQRGGTFIGYFQRYFIKLVNFIENPFFSKWKKENPPFLDLTENPSELS